MTEKSPSLVRASEIGLWAYCHRAWWLAHVQGAAHQTPQWLAHGAKQHILHGERTLWAQRTQRIGLWLFLVALAFLVATLLHRIF
ncbi:MAG: hypothetical protein NZ553_06670 [Caldilinea sp.]|nr:hypothetical protein [Caldilinea sp.]MDW8440135.1 hypothetical protein [Caldilineaceae bacterium]